MAASLREVGPVLVAGKPLRLRRYEVSHLPDPGEHVDALIIVNDRHDGVPRARLALSNGASWDFVALVGDGVAPVAVPQRVDPLDLTPLVRTAVRDLLRELLPQMLPAQPAALPGPRMTVAPPSMAPPEVKGLADAVLRVATTLEDVEERVEFIERHGLARAHLTEVP